MLLARALLNSLSIVHNINGLGEPQSAKPKNVIDNCLECVNVITNLYFISLFRISFRTFTYSFCRIIVRAMRFRLSSG